MLIGQVSRATGASIKAIRLYEQMGLIASPARQGAYRFYDALQIETLRCIKQAQGLGFSLKEIQALIDPVQGFLPNHFSQAIDQKLAAQQRLIDDAERTRQSLIALREHITDPAFCQRDS